MSPFLYLLAGVALGAVIGWLFRSLRQATAPADTRVEDELRKQIAQHQAELTETRSRLTQSRAAQATAEAKQASAEQVLSEQRNLREKALIELREAFKALSADALKQTAPEFLRLAEQSFETLRAKAKGDLTERQEAIKGLVEPLRQHLESYQTRLQRSETEQSGTMGEVKKQLELLSQQSQSLANETQQFRLVLKSNQARGCWGEETLRRVIDAAGMSAHCDFTEQAQAGDSKPDLVIRLPGNRLIIVDSKVPDLDFLNAIDTADTTKRAEALSAHAGKLRTTIKALAERDYPQQFPNALDHVVLFLPAESLFSTALEGDPELIVWAESKGIYLATPASFIAVLRTINFIWQQQAQTENARQIAEAAQEFYSRVVKFTEHFEKIRSGLERANSAFNDATASFQTRVRPAGERLVELGGGVPGKDLTEVQPIESALRLPAVG